MAKKPFCFVAERNGRLFAVTAGDFEVKEFYAKFAGYDIRSIPSREDWDEYRQSVPWGPERKP